MYWLVLLIFLEITPTEALNSKFCKENNIPVLQNNDRFYIENTLRKDNETFHQALLDYENDGKFNMNYWFGLTRTKGVKSKYYIPLANYYIGRYFLEQDEPEKAIPFLVKALESPDFPYKVDTQFKLGLCHSRIFNPKTKELEDPDSAKEYFTSIIENKNAPDSYKDSATQLLADLDSEQALVDIERRMRDVQEKLNKGATGEYVQKQQERILKALDDLIEADEQPPPDGPDKPSKKERELREHKERLKKLQEDRERYEEIIKDMQRNPVYSRFFQRYSNYKDIVEQYYKYLARGKPLKSE